MSEIPDIFDTAHWKRVNEAIDQALELSDSDRDAYMVALAAENADVARSVARLLPRVDAAAQATETQTTPDTTTATTEPLTTALVRPGLTTELATVFRANSPMGDRGFDNLLQRALKAERASQKSARHRGEMCGAWRLMNIIGTGGMGEVWLAERADGLFTARAAVKFLRTDSNTEAFEARFAQERALLARLNHVGIARLLDAGRQFGSPFLVLEYVEGVPLLNYLVEFAPTVEQRLRVFRNIVEAVSYAHTQLVVHRDLKPSNILVTPSGQVKLLDFGVAGLLNSDDPDETTESAATKIAGRGLTLEYAAPEQITGDATGVASDVYSLGALGYHIVCGHRAHVPEKPGRAALEHAVLHTDPKRLSDAARNAESVTARDNFPPPSDIARIDGDLDAIFSRALRRRPQDRYRTADEFLADLRRFSERRPISARREDRAYRSRLWLRRNWLPASLALSVAIALTGGLAVSLWLADRARDEAKRATKTADYLVELLSGADPDLHGGNWPTVLNLIERAQSDIATKFRDEPSVEQRLSQNVATTLRRLSRFQDAYPIAKRSYALSQSLYGEDAMQTRIAGALLADIMYWIDQNDEALPIVERALGSTPPKPLPEWWREAFLLRVNLISETGRFQDAYDGYGQYREHIRGHPLEAWYEAEAETDRALTMMVEGRHEESLRIHNQYRTRLANPPTTVAKRIALTNLNNGDMMRLYMGVFEGVEQAFRKNLEEWDQLAGRQNRHSIEAVGRLGYFYFFHDRPRDAIAMFDEKLSRLRALNTPDKSRELFVRIDKLETESKYFLRPASVVFAEAANLERAAIALTELDAATRDRFLQRIAFVRITFGDPESLSRSVVTLPPSLDTLNQRADRAATRWTAVASVLAATGKMQSACDALSFASDHFGARNRTLVAVPLHLRAALTCALAGSANAATHLSRARAATPDTLPAKHRLRLVTEHVDRVVRSKGSDVMRSQYELAEALGMSPLATAHPALLGLVF
jgi:eukaryotic-like serine/threonine-protein kinase